MGVKGGTPRTIIVDGVELGPIRRKFFHFGRCTNKVYLRIGRLIVEAGWYDTEPCLGVKVFEWFPHAGEIVLVYAQAVKAVLCVSWDYGR